MKQFLAKDIMSTSILSVTPETSVKDLAKFFITHQVSGAPVLDKQERLIGIVTEGDVIFRDAAVHLPTVVTLFDSIIYLENPHKYEHELQKIIGGQVKDIMSQDLVTITPDTTLSEMATIMHEKKRHLLPVMDKDTLIGIVGKADLVRAIAQEENVDEAT